MIHYLKHHQIDKARWDRCISKAVNGRVYACSWYLDLVCPGWEALVEEDYTSVFPLTSRWKGIYYLYQPFFAQQLGLFSSEILTVDKLHEFIAAIPRRFRFIEIHLNTLNKPEENLVRVIPRINYELDLISPYEHLVKQYHQNTIRNLKKAKEQKVTIDRRTETDELVTLFMENFGEREGKLRFRDYEVMRHVIEYCRKNNKGFQLGAFSADGKLSAAAFFIREGTRIYYLFAASAMSARENGAMFLLIDSVIRENAAQNFTFDFEGSNDPGVGRFYQGFGASAVTYPMIRINRIKSLLLLPSSSLKQKP